MNRTPENQKKLPSTQVNSLMVLLLVLLTLYLYGFYWLDKQSSVLKQQFGIAPFNENLIQYGYISFGITICLLVVLDTYQIENIAFSYFPGLLAMTTYTIFLYCSIRYALAIKKILGYKKIDILYLLGALLYNVVFINWWQNKHT